MTVPFGNLEVNVVHNEIIVGLPCRARFACW